MANDPGRVGILDGLIRQSGVPLDGITLNDINAVPPVVTLHFPASATQEQKDLAAQIKDAFDWRLRRALDRLTVVQSIGALTAGQKALIDAHQRAEYLRSNPALAAAIGQAIGAPVVVDEVDPT